MTDATYEAPRGPRAEPGDARRPGPITLTGRFVTLGPPQPGRDAADLFEVTHGRERDRLFAYLSEGPFADEAAMAANFAAGAASRDVAMLVIRDAATGRALGRASYMRIEPGHRWVEVGAILFSPALARTAAATEAMYLMARHAFEDLGFRRYEWKCDALNAPSRTAALRLGFVFEGVFRRHMVVKGHIRDTAWYAMTDQDWPQAKAAFEAWLSPDNFDANGIQKRALAALRMG